jgi:hypothetical protein
MPHVTPGEHSEEIRRGLAVGDVWHGRRPQPPS